jgi:hypothetical protein
VNDIVAEVIKLQPKKGDVLVISGRNMRELERVAEELRMAFAGERALAFPVMLLPNNMDIALYEIDATIRMLERARSENGGYENAFIVQYSHDKIKWFDYGPSVEEHSAPIIFDSLKRARELCLFCLTDTYAGHRWYQRILDAKTGKVLQNIHFEDEKGAIESE